MGRGGDLRGPCTLIRSVREGDGGHIPCFCMTCRNLTMTLEEGRIRTWRLPAFSALLMLLRASLRTEVRTILAVLCVCEGDSQFGQEMRYLPPENVMLALGGSKSVESALLVEELISRGGFCPPSVVKGEAYRGDRPSSPLLIVCVGCDSVIHPRLLSPAFAKGRSFLRTLKSW